MDPFLRVRKKINELGLEKLEVEVPRKFKNEWYTGWAMLMGFRDCSGVVCAEFGPIAQKRRKMSPETL